MRTKSPIENIPSFDNLYEVTKDYIKENQGEKGYINTDNEENGNDNIYGIEFCDESGIDEERIVFGVRVKDYEDGEDLEVLMRPWMRTYHNAPTEEEYNDDSNWESLRWSDVYYVPTLISIAESIEEYVEG